MFQETPPEMGDDSYDMTNEDKLRYKTALCEFSDDYKIVSYILDHTTFIKTGTMIDTLMSAIESVEQILQQRSWVARPCVDVKLVNMLTKDQLSRLTQKQKDTLYLQEVQMYKSNVWVLRLAAYFRTELIKRENIRLTVDDQTLWGQGIDTFVFFDDALYTGNQMFQNIQTTLKAIFKDEEKTYTNPTHSGAIARVSVVIVVPFRSTASEKLVVDKIEQSKYNVNLIWSSCQRLLSISEIINRDLSLSEETKELLKHDLKKFGFSDSYPYRFSHKTADSLSSFPNIYSGIIPPLLRGDKLCPGRATTSYVPLVPKCPITDIINLRRGNKVGGGSLEESLALVPDWTHHLLDFHCPPPVYKPHELIHQIIDY